MKMCPGLFCTNESKIINIINMQDIQGIANPRGYINLLRIYFSLPSDQKLPHFQKL